MRLSLHWLRTWTSGRAGSAVLLALTLAACGGGGGGGMGPGANLPPDQPQSSGCSATNPSACGVLLLGFTDAEGDIVSYTLDVRSLRLTRSDGTSVDTLPATERIDFAELTNLSELVSASLLPPGQFTSGTITVDYSAAEIFVEAGGDIVAADVRGPDGQPLGVVTLEIQFPADEPLVLRRGARTLLSLDLDLATSNSVDTATVPPVVTAEPFFVAEFTPVDEKPMRVRGTLEAVDEVAHSYTVSLSRHHRQRRDHGPVTVNVTAETAFEINGAEYTGVAGLAALATLEAGTPSTAVGILSTADRTFTASTVLAGDSVAGTRFDAVHGNIVARDGNTLTVKGARTRHRDRDEAFVRTVTVELGPDTLAWILGAPQTHLDTDRLSVGQQITAFGEFPSGDTPPTDLPPVLNATAGGIRMHPTLLRGRVAGMVPGELELELRAIDRLSADLFDFSGTGLNTALDADPTAYQVATGTLPLDALTVDAGAKAIGFPAAFGAGPPDFEARTLIGNAAIPAALGMGYPEPGSAAAFLSLSAAEIVLNVGEDAGIGERHHLKAGHELLDVLEMAAPPTIFPAQQRAVFSLWTEGRSVMFFNFERFVEALQRRLNDGHTIRWFTAYGGFDEFANTLRANKIMISTLPPAAAAD